MGILNWYKNKVITIGKLGFLHSAVQDSYTINEFFGSRVMICWSGVWMV